MRYTKAALLIFGGGLVLALVVVVAEIGSMQRIASTAMAFGIAALPVGMAVDWRLATRTPRPAGRRRGKTAARRHMSAPVCRRPRKAARSHR